MMETLIDHVLITVKDLDRSIAFYETALKPLGIVHALDYDGKNGPEGHPDLKGFGRDGRVFFWLRQGDADARAAHIGFVAKSEAEVNAFYQAAMAAGATDNGKPGARLYYDPRYYAANVFDPDGYSLEAVYKSWQHPKHNASEFQEGLPFTLTKRRVQARHTEASAISAPESNSNAQNVSETSELPQKRPPLLLILH